MMWSHNAELTNDLVMFAVEVELVLCDGRQPDCVSEATGGRGPRVYTNLTSRRHLTIDHRLTLQRVTDTQTYHDLSPTHHSRSMSAKMRNHSGKVTQGFKGCTPFLSADQLKLIDCLRYQTYYLS